jgi:hypothetical protein
MSESRKFLGFSAHELSRRNAARLSRAQYRAQRSAQSRAGFGQQGHGEA